VKLWPRTKPVKLARLQTQLQPLGTIVGPANDAGYAGPKMVFTSDSRREETFFSIEEQGDTEGAIT